MIRWMPWTGFLTANDDARARPVGVAIAKDGALLLGDDVGNTVCLRSPPRAEPSASAPLPKFVIHESTSRPNFGSKGALERVPLRLNRAQSVGWVSCKLGCKQSSLRRNPPSRMCGGLRHESASADFVANPPYGSIRAEFAVASKLMILVPLFDLKFLEEHAARVAGTSNRRH